MASKQRCRKKSDTTKSPNKRRNNEKKHINVMSDTDRNNFNFPMMINSMGNWHLPGTTEPSPLHELHSDRYDSNQDQYNQAYSYYCVDEPYGHSEPTQYFCTETYPNRHARFYGKSHCNCCNTKWIIDTSDIDSDRQVPPSNNTYTVEEPDSSDEDESIRQSQLCIEVMPDVYKCANA